MKAAQIADKFQPARLVEVPTPSPLKGEVLIRLKAAALNRRDWWIQQGQYAAISYPTILGSDGAGIIETVGQGVSQDLVGKEVIINPGLNWGDNRVAPAKTFSILGMPSQGTLAQYIAVLASHVVQKPRHLSWEEAAAIPLAGLTAHRALFFRANLQPGERLLVTGAGGGAAQFALQFGLAVGAEVWVTSSSPEKLDSCRVMGAKGGVLYTEAGWEKQLKEKAGLFDVVIDSAAGPDFNKVLEVSADGGRVAFFGGTAGPWPAMPAQRLFWKQISLLGSTMGSPADFADMVALVEAAHLKPTLSKVFELEDAEAAIQYMGLGEGIGKIVVRSA